MPDFHLLAWLPIWTAHLRELDESILLQLYSMHVVAPLFSHASVPLIVVFQAQWSRGFFASCMLGRNKAKHYNVLSLMTNSASGLLVPA